MRLNPTDQKSALMFLGYSDLDFANNVSFFSCTAAMLSADLAISPLRRRVDIIYRILFTRDISNMQSERGFFRLHSERGERARLHGKLPLAIYGPSEADSAWRPSISIVLSI